MALGEETIPGIPLVPNSEKDTNSQRCFLLQDRVDLLKRNFLFRLKKDLHAGKCLVERYLAQGPFTTEFTCKFPD